MFQRRNFVGVKEERAERWRLLRDRVGLGEPYAFSYSVTFTPPQTFILSL